MSELRSVDSFRQWDHITLRPAVKAKVISLSFTIIHGVKPAYISIKMANKSMRVFVLILPAALLSPGE